MLWTLNLNSTHCYFTRLNIKKGPLQSCFPVFLGNQINFLIPMRDSWWPVHWVRPSQSTMKNCIFFGPNALIWSAMKVPYHDCIQNVSQALCLSKWWNGIKGISTVPYRNLEFLWIPSKTGRQNWRVIIFLSFNLIEWQCEPGPIAASDFSFIFRPCHSFYGHSVGFWYLKCNHTKNLIVSTYYYDTLWIWAKVPKILTQSQGNEIICQNPPLCRLTVWNQPISCWFRGSHLSCRDGFTAFFLHSISWHSVLIIIYHFIPFFVL